MKNSRHLSFRIRHTIFWLFILNACVAKAQLDAFPLHQEYIEKARDLYAHLDSSKHTASQPFEIRNPQIHRDFFYVDSNKYYTVFKDKLLRDDLFKVNTDEFKVKVNPLFDLSLGQDLKDTSAYADTTRFFRNTRGIKIDGQIGQKLYFHTAFFENQAAFPLWIKELSDSLGVVPSSGRHKAFNETGFDFGFSQGWLSYYPIENINLFFGHSKQFIGHGYRSLLLSHQGFNYPHLKYTLTLLKGDLQISWSLAALQTLERQPLGEVPESLFKKKGGSFSYINYLLGKRVQIGLFEGNIWRRYNNDDGSQPLTWKAHVPVPLFGVLAFNNQDQQTRRIGLNTQVKISNKSSVYGQYVFAENGIQAGFKTYDFLLKGFRIRVEYNTLENQNTSENLIDFTNFNESLNHPASSEIFKELVTILHFQKHRFVSNVTLSNIYSSNDRSTVNTSLGYIINPRTNTQLNIGFLFRKQQGVYESGFLHFGIKSNVFDSFYNY